MHNQHLDQQLCFALYSASRRVTQEYDHFLRPFDLTYPQYLVMLVLWQWGRLPVKNIGAYLSLDSGTLSPLLKKLERKKLITKLRQQDDERVVMIGLTLLGKALQKKTNAIPHEMSCRLALTKKEFVKLRSQLQDVVKTLAP